MRIAQIFRFPIKGLPGEKIDSAAVSKGSGLEGDRRVAFGNGTIMHREDQWESCLSFTILKNNKSLQKWRVHSQPPLITMTAPVSTGAAPLRFDVNNQADMDAARAYLSKYLPPQGPIPRKLVSAPQGMFDSHLSGISIINPNTVAELSRVSGVHMDPRRYRGNLLIDGLPAYAEYGLIGKVLRIGNVRIAITKSIARCSATSVNPVSTEVDTNGPRLLATYFGHIHCGIYGTVLDSGVLETGAEIQIEDDSSGAEELVPSKVSPRFMTVLRNQDLGAGVFELLLEDPFGWIGEHYQAGMHLRVHLPGPLWRNYTITSVAGPRIGIDVRVQGEASTKIAQLNEGEQVLVSGPYGVLTSTKVLGACTAIVSAGIGITPALGLLGDASAANDSRKLRIIHVERGRASALYSRLEQMASELKSSICLNRIDTTEDRPGPAEIARHLQGCDSVVMCGPEKFTSMVFEACERAGIPASQIHREIFASPTTDLDRLFEDYPSAEVTCRDSRRSFTWSAKDGVLLEALEDQGVEPASLCRSGSCGECAVKLLRGRVSYPLEPSARVEQDQILTCMAVPAGDIELGA